ncbi:MAG: histidine kinase dimerization/phosphoacceptor domain -containing protein, partial [Verrucomicrobiota bacterium]
HDRPSFNQRVADALSRGKWTETATFIRPDGSEGQCEVFYVAVAEEDRPPAIIGVNREVKPGESSQSPDASASAVAAGRMAADLQTIINLISLHLSFAGSTDLRFALRQNQERIRSIALIHQLLEAEESIDAKINLLTYLKQLRRALLQDFNVAPEDIVIRLVCPDDLLVPASQALALGLITSEFLAETLQHAGKSGRTGAMAIALTLFEGFAEFRIEDDGLDIPDNLKTLDGSDLSMEIIKSLAQQLNAELSLIANPQHALSLRFPVS